VLPVPAARWRLLGSTAASGALLNVAAASRVGGFDADLFLDYVDHDFCLRLRRAGFQIIEASEVRMLPPPGKMAIPLSGKPAPMEPYAPLRRYYITRNRMLLWRRYRRFDLAWILADMRAFFREIFSMLLWEKDLRAKLWMMGRGALDALRNARGELSGHKR
jgi:rhamnosyltransferase